MSDNTYPLDFEELALKITALPNGACTVSVIQSAYGAQDAEFETASLPFSPPELRTALEPFSQQSGAREVQALSSQHEPRVTAEQVGAVLFRALFSGSLLRLFHLALGRAEAAKSTGLRIRLVFDPTRPESALVSSLPWELLYREETREFLARNPLTPIVRYLETPRLKAPASIEPPLRILLILSSPPDTAKLKLEQECERIREALGRPNDTEIKIMAQPTLLQIRRLLLSEPFHILHFMGHGTTSNITGSGFLLFQDEHRRTQLISGPAFAETVKTAKHLRLIVLNACKTAQYSSIEGQDPYSGAASALLMAGIPSVIAMQQPITDQAALVFSEHLYTALAANMSIDAAAAEARLAIYLSDPKSIEWATPALFMSSPDGNIGGRPQKVTTRKEDLAPNQFLTPGANLTLGGRGGVTIGGTGNTIQGGIRVNGSGRDDDR